jgi:hypothetical protein
MAAATGAALQNAPYATFAGGWCLNLLKDTVYWRNMKRLGKIVVCLAGGLVLNAGARADDAVLPNNPYAPVVIRNIFGLNPLPTNDVNAAQADPPPKITLNGIMSIFGHLQALFKVAIPAKPEQPAKDVPYILSEGQRQDEIEVVQIDEKNGLVTFNNHGTVQELPLAKAGLAGGTATPGPGRPAVPTPNITAPSGDNSGRIPGRFGSRTAGGPAAARNGGMGNGGNNFNNGMGGGSPIGGGSSLTPGSTPYTYDPAGQQPSQMTAEESAMLIEAQRLLLQNQNNPKAKLLPPTMYTPQNSGAGKGASGAPPSQ